VGSGHPYLRGVKCGTKLMRVGRTPSCVAVCAPSVNSLCMHFRTLRQNGSGDVDTGKEKGVKCYAMFMDLLRRGTGKTGVQYCPGILTKSVNISSLGL
jgi:hypothetical protein